MVTKEVNKALEHVGTKADRRRRSQDNFNTEQHLLDSIANLDIKHRSSTKKSQQLNEYFNEDAKFKHPAPSNGGVHGNILAHIDHTTVEDPSFSSLDYSISTDNYAGKSTTAIKRNSIVPSSFLEQEIASLENHVSSDHNKSSNKQQQQLHKKHGSADSVASSNQLRRRSFDKDPSKPSNNNNSNQENHENKKLFSPRSLASLPTHKAIQNATNNINNTNNQPSVEGFTANMAHNRSRQRRGSI